MTMTESVAVPVRDERVNYIQWGPEA
jgi:hypothetical protein